MGWASGSRLFSDIIIHTKSIIADEQTRYQLYEGYVDAFENCDWDTLEECIGLDSAYNRLIGEKYPE